MAGDCTGDLDLFYFNLYIKWCGRLLCNAGLSACLYFDDFCCDYIYTDCGGTFSRHKEKNRSTRPQKSELLRGAMSILLMALLTNGVVKLNERFSYSCMDDRQYCRMHQVAEEYQGADCLYVASSEDNLLQSLWFEFGNYGKFKRLREGDYCRIVNSAKNGLDSILSGHDFDKPVVLYLPNTLELPGNARLIDETDDFLIAILNG